MLYHHHRVLNDIFLDTTRIGLRALMLRINISFLILLSAASLPLCPKRSVLAAVSLRLSS